MIWFSLIWVGLVWFDLVRFVGLMVGGLDLSMRDR